MASEAIQPKLSFWKSYEGRLDQQLRVALRQAGVKGPLADLVLPLKAEVLAFIEKEHGVAYRVDSSSDGIEPA